MNISRQIGWGTESNLLYQILKQITRLTSIMFSLKPKYKVFTALVSQVGTPNSISETSGLLIVGVSYNIDVYNVGDDFSNVGGPGLGQQGEWEGRYFIATATTPNNWSNGSTLIYNEGAPVVIVLENTIGNIWFTYNSVGSYGINSNSLFTNNKTFIDNANIGEGLNVFNRLINNGIFGGSQKGYYFIKPDELLISLKTLEDVETPADNIISGPICVEIRVYN